MKRTTTLKVGQNKGHPRIYIEGKWLLATGFHPGNHYKAEFESNRIRLVASKTGRCISGKKQGTCGVIDLNCDQIQHAFNSIERITIIAADGQIVITPSRTSLQRSRRKLTSRAISIFAGGGLLSQAARTAGFETVAAVEVDTRYADIYQSNHGGHMFNCSVEQVPWEQLARMSRREPIGLLEMGIPCEPYSMIRRLDRGGQNKRDRNLPPEAHELGDMVYWAIKAVDVINPHTAVIEQVPKFLESGAWFILHLAMQRMGYAVEARVINSLDYGALTSRRRAVIVATTFDHVNWPEPQVQSSRLGTLLEDIPLDSDLWFNPKTKPWLYDHWRKQSDKGNGFEPPRLSNQSRSCPTIKKRYFAGQGDNPVVQHPAKADHHRWLTLNEAKRIMGLPRDYELGAAKTTAGKVIGQGVQVDTFVQIIRSITKEVAHESIS